MVRVKISLLVASIMIILGLKGSESEVGQIMNRIDNQAEGIQSLMSMIDYHYQTNNEAEKTRIAQCLNKIIGLNESLLSLWSDKIGVLVNKINKEHESLVEIKSRAEMIDNLAIRVQSLENSMLSVEKQLSDLTLGDLKVAFTWTNGIRILSMLGIYTYLYYTVSEFINNFTNIFY